MTPADHANTVREELITYGCSDQSVAALDALEAQAERSWPVELVALEKRIVAAEAERDRLADALRRCKFRATDLHKDIERIVDAALTGKDT